MVITSATDSSHPTLTSSRTLPLGMSMTELSRSMEMLNMVDTRTRSVTLPYNITGDPYSISGDVPFFSRNAPTAFSVSYSSDKEEISFSNRY